LLLLPVPTYAYFRLKSLNLIFARSILTLALLCPATLFAQDFMGLRLGMTSKEAFKVTGKKVDLTGYKVIGGKKIVNDTIGIGECNAYFRRSIAFDSLQRLKVVGLTYRSGPNDIEDVKTCTLNWLEKKYGKPEIDSLTNDTVDTYIWREADATITMDSRPYNERHSFVLVYFFRSDMVATKED
jgi:hypothetical protein